MATVSERTVVVGISGGVDSSVSAHLLSKDGWRVIGLFLSGWHPPDALCASPYDRQDAMRVCARLGIEFEEIDAHQLFNDEVIEPFFAAYERGETPNPDVLCNSKVKFRLLARAADALRAAHIATGHYARKDTALDDPPLLNAIDSSKDQTYFLWDTERSLLERTLFPVGDLTKREVRAIAKKIDLHTAEKKDSVGLCFVGDVSVSALLEKRLGKRSGTVHLSSGEEVGTHEGVWYYTEGQRSGFSLHTPHSSVPHFVVGKDVKENALVVSPTAEDAYTDNIRLTRTNFFVDVSALSDITLFVQLRHLGKRVPVNDIETDGETVILTCSELVLAPHGQSAVLYTPHELSDAFVCLGGGVIEK